MPLSKEKNKERMNKSRVQPNPSTGTESTHDSVGQSIQEGSKEAGWLAVKTYVQRSSSGMDNLERLKRISGSLGPHAAEVMFGPTALTFQDIGEVLGVEAGKYGK